MNNDNGHRGHALRVGVLGGGALGLAAAYRLAQAGVQVTVLEKDEVIGGLAASFDVGGAKLEKFYHHLFRSDRVITALIGELGLAPKLVWKPGVTANLIGGEIYRMDPARLLTLPILPPVDRLRFFLGMAYLKLQKNYHRFEGETAAHWTQRWMGTATYEVMWRPLLESKFGPSYQKIAMPWLWSRVYCRSLALGYLRGGFHQLYEALADRIRTLGGIIRTGQTVEKISSPDSDWVQVTVNGKTEEFDRVICTLPTRLFTQLAEGLSDDYRRQYDWGDYQGAHCVVLSLDRQLMRTYWLSVNDANFPFLVAVEHTNYMPADDYGGQHLVYLGNYLPMSDRRFTMGDQETVDWYLPHLTKINPSFDRSWVKKFWVFKAPFAQPIVTVDYHNHIPPHETPLPGVFLANMFQVYPHDRGQNYSIEMAYRVADLVLRSPATLELGVG